ncbi:hydantoinase/oxoprolinase family protein [Thermanaerosceptrum fracticalcis]|uniref:Hydantoinase/oxoprolinase family protein n=1 Tax=Thermanaerosceptrum fracticalcis TaxID=1712410 RepID=A0A7G6E0P8_THEFR|nr:hydantoinase/oxoprolinase family protein [Thermanaerosceptrum fracticalcis]QNB45652.1 hydantoinase/oxoprolinase family protein [Thermanaerosceptrum fracticalcis]
MLIGIDVGGTFTDGVLLDNFTVKEWVKVRTKEDLTRSIQEVLNHLLEHTAQKTIERLVLSTTLITNLLAQKKYEPAGLLLLPGPGANPYHLSLPGEFVVLKGAIDYRGRIIEPIDLKEVEEAAGYLLSRGLKRIVVTCKFSQRNNTLEKQVVRHLQHKYPDLKVKASFETSGLLNWVRRINATYYTLAVEEACHHFLSHISHTLERIGLKSPVYIMKADGGTIPLDLSRKYPLEAIFSGPAASTLGGMACTSPDITSVVMDMGGTTTDLALVLKGTPLLSSKGATIGGFPTPVRALAVASLPIGGDTPLVENNRQLAFGQRKGPALCLGGPELTLTDILVYLGYSSLGQKETIAPFLHDLANRLELSPRETAERALDLLISLLEEALTQMYTTWEEEPAYRVWQVMAEKSARPRTLICLGGPAEGIGQLWAKKREWQVIVPTYAKIANAIGAALACTTLNLDFVADTENLVFYTSIGGKQGTLEHPLRTLDEARAFALSLLKEMKGDWQNHELERVETLYEEGFNIVREWRTRGKIYQIGLQTPPGILGKVKGA